MPADGLSLDLRTLRGELSPYAAPPLLTWSQVVISHLLRSPGREGKGQKKPSNKEGRGSTSSKEKLGAFGEPGRVRAAKGCVKGWPAVGAVCRLGASQVVCGRVPLSALLHSAHKRPSAAVDQVVAVELHR
jgi:hypothetical protein